MAEPRATTTEFWADEHGGLDGAYAAALALFERLRAERGEAIAVSTSEGVKTTETLFLAYIDHWNRLDGDRVRTGWAVQQWALS